MKVANQRSSPPRCVRSHSTFPAMSHDPILVDTPALLDDRIGCRADPRIHRSGNRCRQHRDDADAIGTHGYGGINQERQPLVLHAPQCLGDVRQRDVARDDVFGEIAIDRAGVGWWRVLAGEAEQGRGEHVLGERSNGRPRCERILNLPVQCGDGLFRGAGHPPGCAVSQPGPQLLGFAHRERSRFEVSLPIERGDDLHHRVCGRHAVSLAPEVHSAHGCVLNGDRAHDDPNTDPRER